MPTNTNDDSSRYRIVTCEGMPVAVLADQVDEGTTRISAAELDVLTQGYMADEPWHLSMDPQEAHDLFKTKGLLVGLGAKEGHGITRQGVDLVGLAPPERTPVPGGTRRAVVALLDTVVSYHPWIGDGTEEDPFWRDARQLTPAWEPQGAGHDPLPVPDKVGDSTSTHAGHATFITGMVRLLAPGATVISLPVMDSTGVVDPELLESALGWLLERVQRSVKEDRPDLAVDVVNLSFGRYLAKGQQVPREDPVRDLLDCLGDYGVRVIASAGNRGSELEVVPAAWSGKDTDERTALRSVGALDPDGGRARYSNTGSWVSVGARGTALVSCLPRFKEVAWPPEAAPGGELTPEGMPAVTPEALAAHEDPNLQLSTFGRWSGTSFAAAVVSAAQADRLMILRIDGGLPAEGAPVAAREHPDRAAEARRRAALVWGTFAPMPDRTPAGDREP